MFILFSFVFIVNNLGLMILLKIYEYNFWIFLIVNFGVDIILLLLVVFICYIEGICKKGIGGYFKGFLLLILVMFLMNLLEEVINVVLLVLCFFGNIFFGEVVIGLFL